MSGWDGWAALNGDLLGGAPAVGRDADGRLEVFADGPGVVGPVLFHIWQDPASPTAWSGWGSLDAPPPQFLGSPGVGSNADGRLEAFVRVGLMSTGALWHIWQTAPNNGWNGWDNLGGGIGPHFLRVARNADGRQEVFLLNSVGHLQHIWQTAPNGSWSAWSDFGSPVGTSLVSATVGQNADGRLEVFALATDGALWHIWQTAPNGTWSGWSSLGAPSGVNLALPAAARNQDGRLEVFAIGSFNSLWHIWQLGGGGGWSSWDSLGTPSGATSLNEPALARNADGRLEVFVTEMNGTWHRWQTAPGAGWSAWDNLGGSPDGPVGIGQNTDGRLEIFAEGVRAPSSIHSLWHRWQLTPGGAWSVSEDWELTLAFEPAQQLCIQSGGAIFVRTANGVFRSTDDALTWTSVTMPAAHALLALDPTSTTVLYAAGGNQVFKSSNDGSTWSPILSTPSVQAIGIAVSPANHNLLYLATAQGSGSFDFRRSLDGGATWTILEGPLNGPTCTWTVLILFPHPSNELRVLRTSGCYAGFSVSFGDSLKQSTDRGATFTSLFHPTPLFPSRLVGGQGSQPMRFYLGAHFGASPGGGKLFRSDDDGATWTTILNFTSGPSVSGLAYDPSAPGKVYAGLTDATVQISHDAGSTWAQLGGSVGMSNRVTDLALTLDGQYLLAASDQGVFRIKR
ncbi:MAG: hypothetical protein LC797_16440 [Chloroflexi bacterium]|nr:hypothetical protein [Chloroflexota bacterium]